MLNLAMVSCVKKVFVHFISCLGVKFKNKVCETLNPGKHVHWIMYIRKQTGFEQALDFSEELLH